MKTYSVGWSIYGPHANYLKHFIHHNKDTIGFSGIIFPKKITDKIETVPLFDFEDNIFQPGKDVFFIDCMHFDCFHPNYRNLRNKFTEFFRNRNCDIVKVGDFINLLIKNDVANSLHLPFKDISSSNIQWLHNEPEPVPMGSDPLLDIESWRVLDAMDKIFRTSNWDDILKFDQEKTLDQELLDAVLEISKLEQISNFYIDSNAANFMDVLLAFQFKSGESIHGNTNFSVQCSEDSVQSLGDRIDFYQHAFGARLSIVPSLPPFKPEHLILTGDACRTLDKTAGYNLPKKMVAIMPRSIFDYYRALSVYRNAKVDIKAAMRQPDTQFSHLVGMFFAP